jgi:UDP-N-acetylmuramyl pentapeptide phosphotransferase/UDP-N-acetylglucosamine-1-phosphate transferase
MIGRRPWLPQTRAGVWAVLAGLMALSLWVILPMVTIAYREIYPITDSWVMPTIGGVVSIIVAALNVYVVWWRGQRAWLNLIAMVVLVVIALMSLLVLVGGVIEQLSA